MKQVIDLLKERYGLTGDAAKRFNEIVSEVCYLTGASKSLPGGASTK